MCGHLRGDRQSYGNFIGSGLAALIHSRSLVGSGSGSGGGGGGCDDMRRRYALPICIADMVRRYAGPETEKAKSVLLLAPDVVCFCDSLLLFDPLDYLPHISGDDSSNEVF